MSRPAVNPALLHLPRAPTSGIRFRVLTPDHHPIAVTVHAAPAAATALAVARHHPAGHALIAGSDGRWLDVYPDGRSTLRPAGADDDGWPAAVELTLARLAPTPRPDDGP